MSVLCMFGMALIRPSLTMQLTSGVEVFAHECGQKALRATIVTIFSHMTRDISVLPCDAMHKRGYCRHAVSVCLPVRLSVCLSRSWVAPKWIKISSKFFHCSQAILVFPYQTGWRYSDGNPPNGGVECKGVWKNHDFWPISRCISGLMETAPILNDLKWPLTQISRYRYYSTSNN